MARKKQRVVKHDMGPEPTKIETQSDLLRAYQWYNYEYSAKQGRKFLEAYVKKNVKGKTAILDKMKDHEIPTGLMWQAKMIDSGILPKESQDHFEARLAELFQNVKKEKTVKVATTSKPSVQDRINAQVFSWIADIEDEIDQLGTKVKSDFNPYEFLKTVEAKPVHVNKIVEYYKPIRDEVVEAVAGKDEQLNEAYSYLNKSALKRLAAFYETLVSDCERVINNTKAVRKPRKRKVKSADQIVKSVKYLPESKEYKIVSASPDKLVGATQVWVFNVKYKSLTVYNALDGGIGVKGTTLQNFDPDKSISKRVRKPEEALNAVTKSGKVALRKLMDTFNTKASEAKGRINQDTLIVRIL